MRSSRPPSPPPPPRSGDRFGPFTIVERLGVGWMAEVLTVTQEPDGGGVTVVKRMLAHVAAEPGAARMFEEEAHLGASVEDENVVRVLGAGDIGGQPYIELEHVPGMDLAHLMRWLQRSRIRVSHEVAVFVTRAILGGLEAVHALEIVHGDVSPSNVLLGRGGEVKLADFGIARSRLRAVFPQAAAAGRTRGKLGYLAPEQVRGQPIDRRVDIFAAAVICAELLIGEPLFGAGSELTTLLAIRDGRVDPLLEHEDHLPAALVDTLLGALASNPDRRTGSATELRAALEPFEPWPSASRAELADLVCGGADTGRRPRTPLGLSTVPPDGDRYLVQTSEGSLGPLGLAELLEALRLGRVSPDDAVSKDDAPAVCVRDLPAVADRLAAPPARRSDERSMANGELVDALALSMAARADGVWICVAGEVRKEIYLIDGVPEFVGSNVAGELLGEHLVARGALTRGELGMALAMLPRYEGRLGDTLAALGLVEPVELFHHLVDQVRGRLLETFTWPEGVASFHDGARPPKQYFPLGLDPWEIVLEGIARRTAAGLEEARMEAWRATRLGRAQRPAPDALPARVHRALELATEGARFADVMARAADLAAAYAPLRLAIALGLVTVG